MKKNILTLIPLIILLISCAGSAKPAESPAAASTGMTLDKALHEAASRIDERIPIGSKIAPLNFNSPHDKFSGYVLDELTANLVDSRRLTVVDRKEVDLIRSEFDFQFSGEVGDDSMQELGRMLGAQAIISGSLTDMGNFYRIVIRVLNVQNASVEVQYRANIANDTVMAALLTGGRSGGTRSTPQRTAAQTGAAPATQTAAAPAAHPAPAPAPTAPPAPPATAAPVAPPAPTTYKIGDTGPAGGLVFYDKGNNSGGWRYLEAAPADIARKLFATSEAVSVESQRTVGTGRVNTRAIMVQANNRGGGFGWAAQACDAYTHNGFDDWFLPSRDELNFMYGNLHMRNLGGFSPDWYWSSTYGEDMWGWGTHHQWWGQNFSDGEQAFHVGNRDHGGVQYRVRPIRQF